MWCLFSDTLDFDKQSYKDNDAVGKKLLTAFLCKHGHTVSENSDKYGIDLVSEINGKKYYWEVEIKNNVTWTDSSDFPYPTVSFLARKVKWKDKNFWYVIISGKKFSAIFAHSSKIFDEKYREQKFIRKDNRFGSDHFYRVPLSVCTFLTPDKFLRNEG